jgi:two-component system LytT family response regulator
MNKKLTAVIVDDERLARKALSTTIEETGSIKVAGEADSVISAIAIIEQISPDVVFLDIQMPGESGFDLLDKIDPQIKVIFVTAFDEYAIRAFEVNAIDYLMKPVTTERLKLAISRLETENGQNVISRGKLQPGDRLFILFTSHYIFLKIDFILYIASSGDYSEVYTTEGKHGLTNKPMNEWEERLPANNFSRIHRSTIINIEHVVKIEEWFNNSFRVYLNGVEKPFTMSRRYASLIKTKMG